MNNFVYTARDLGGEETRGYRRGASQHEVYAWLHKHGLIPVEVMPMAPTSAGKSRDWGYKEPHWWKESEKKNEPGEKIWECGCNQKCWCHEHAEPYVFQAVVKEND